MRKLCFGLLGLMAYVSIIPSCYGQTIIPQPTKMVAGGDAFTLNKSTKIICNENAFSDAKWFCDWLNAATGEQFVPLVSETNTTFENAIVLNCGQPVDEDSEKFKSLPENIRTKLEGRVQEDYKLIVSKDFIWIQAPTSAGVYGIQSLRQLLPVKFENGKGELPTQVGSCIIDDYPAFQHRGLF